MVSVQIKPIHTAGVTTTLPGVSRVFVVAPPHYSLPKPLARETIINGWISILRIVAQREAIEKSLDRSVHGAVPLREDES